MLRTSRRTPATNASATEFRLGLRFGSFKARTPAAPECGRELLREQRVAVMDQHPLALEEAILGVGEIPGPLEHLRLAGVGVDAGDLDPPGGHVDDEEDQVAGQALQAPGLDGEEVAGS